MNNHSVTVKYLHDFRTNKKSYKEDTNTMYHLCN